MISFPNHHSAPPLTRWLPFNVPGLSTFQLFSFSLEIFTPLLCLFFILNLKAFQSSRPLALSCTRMLLKTNVLAEHNEVHDFMYFVAGFFYFF